MVLRASVRHTTRAFSHGQVRNYRSSIDMRYEAAILAAGGGYILMIGSPGKGKSMLAHSVPVRRNGL